MPVCCPASGTPIVLMDHGKIGPRGPCLDPCAQRCCARDSALQTRGGRFFFPVRKSQSKMSRSSRCTTAALCSARTAAAGFTYVLYSHNAEQHSLHPSRRNSSIQGGMLPLTFLHRVQHGFAGRARCCVTLLAAPGALAVLPGSRENWPAIVG